MRTSQLLILAVLLVACSDDRPDDSFGQCAEMIREKPVVLRAKIDLALVIANATSMSEEQAALAGEMGWFVDRLAAAPLGFLPDLHIGVLSDDGAGLEVPAGCPQLSGGDAFVIDELIDESTGTRSFNHTVELDEQLACMVQLGTGGSDVSRPLASLVAAVEDGSGFRRPAVALAVAIVTDGEDLSSDDAVVYAQRVGAKAPAGTFVSVVSGGAEGCTLEGFTEAAPAPRLVDFASAFGEHGAAVSLCGEEPLLEGLAGMLWRVPAVACLDPALGPAPDCRVSDVRNLDRNDQEEYPIPSCDKSEPPCFEIGDGDCGAPGRLQLQVNRGGRRPPEGTVPVARCVVDETGCR